MPFASPGSGEFSVSFQPRILDAIFGSTLTVIRVASPEPGLSSKLIWGTSSQLRPCLVAVLLVPYVGPSWCCSAALFSWTVAAGCASLCEQYESGAQHRQEE